MCNEIVFICGIFWVCGEMFEIFLVYVEFVYWINLFGDEIELIHYFDLFMGEIYDEIDYVVVWLVSYYVIEEEILDCVVVEIKVEFDEWLVWFYEWGKEFEVHCLLQWI